MLYQCVSPRKCLTVITGFLNGLHPLIEDGIVDREACFHGYLIAATEKLNFMWGDAMGFMFTT